MAYSPSAVHQPVLVRESTPLGLGELVRISVRDAARNARQPVATFEADVQLVEVLPELGLHYVQDARGTRFAVDQDTERDTELLPGAHYRALVNAEGYALKVSRLPG
jgi:hypothetical protein